MTGRSLEAIDRELKAAVQRKKEAKVGEASARDRASLAEVEADAWAMKGASLAQRIDLLMDERVEVTHARS